jgi:hypothetical protein
MLNLQDQIQALRYHNPALADPPSLNTRQPFTLRRALSAIVLPARRCNNDQFARIREVAWYGSRIEPLEPLRQDHKCTLNIDKTATRYITPLAMSRTAHRVVQLRSAAPQSVCPSHPRGVNHTTEKRSPRNGRVQCRSVQPLNSSGLYRISCTFPSTTSSPPE